MEIVTSGVIVADHFLVVTLRFMLVRIHGGSKSGINGLENVLANVHLILVERAPVTMEINSMSSTKLISIKMFKPKPTKML